MGKVQKVTRHVSYLLRTQGVAPLVRKGVGSLRSNGIKNTWQRARKTYVLSSMKQDTMVAELFSAEELAAQRTHSFSRPVVFSIVVPLYNTPTRFLREMLESVMDQTYPTWELCLADGSDARHARIGSICQDYSEQDARVHYQRLENNLGISGNSNAALEMASGDYVCLLDHDDLLHPAALFELARAINETGADFLYTDETTFRNRPTNAYNPHFKPGFAPDTLRANNYICHLTCFKRSLLDETGGFDSAFDGSQDHDLVLRLTEKAQRVAHIPEVLYYWRAHSGSAAQGTQEKPYAQDAGVRAVSAQLKRLGLAGEVGPVRDDLTIYRARFEIAGTPKVSILILNRDHLKELRSCLSSIFEKTTYPSYEVVVVENGSSSRELFAYYEQLQREHDNVRVLTWEGSDEFNYSALNNFGAGACTGNYLLLLNNDTRVVTPDWLQEMLMFAQRDDVGAVGAKLCYPNNSIQHAGVCLGMSVASHFFKGVPREELGYMGRLIYAQNLSAVTGACLLMRRELWDEMGGLDEGFAEDYQDVDLCLRLRAVGYLVVWTPFAELIHDESKTRQLDEDPYKRKHFVSDMERFKERWRSELEAGDPYFNPNFVLTRSDFVLESQLRPHAARVTDVSAQSSRQRQAT